MLCLLILYLVLAITFIISLVIIYVKKNYTFWIQKNVPSLPATVPFGNFKSFLLQRKSIGQAVLDIYNKVKYSGKPYYGLYMLWNPTLLLLNLELIQTVLATDFPNFQSRQRQTNPSEPLSEHLLNVSGSQWKFLRTKLTPTFTSGKIKFMFQTIEKCANELNTIINKHVIKNEPLEIKDLMGRFTTDVIALCGFGVECNSLEDPENEFRRQGKQIFTLTKWEHAKSYLMKFFPILAKVLPHRINMESRNFFLNLVKTTVEHRETNNIKSADFLDLLIQLKSQGFIEESKAGGNNFVEETKLTIGQLAAQCYLFLAAGFETSSTTLYMAMYELSQNNEIQDRARNEVKNVLKKYDDVLTYDSLNEMQYLEQIIEETLRLHPPLTILHRKCTSDYKFKDTNLEIKKGTPIYIPVMGIHRDSRYYKNPEHFDPNHFTADEKAKRHAYAFLPFGAGPRQCIGLRFAKVQVKVGLVTLLKNYKFTLNAKTETPLKINPRNVGHNVMGGIWLDAKEIID